MLWFRKRAERRAEMEKNMRDWRALEAELNALLPELSGTRWATIEALCYNGPGASFHLALALARRVARLERLLKHFKVFGEAGWTGLD